MIALMNRRKRLLSLGGILTTIIASMVILVLRVAPTSAVRPVAAGDQNYTFGTPQAGQSYRVSMKHYKRYGPLRETVYSNPDSQLWPETSVIEGRGRIGTDGQYYDCETRIYSEDGQLWFTFSAPQGDVYTVTNHRSGKQEPGPRIPPMPQNPYSGSGNFGDVLRELGWKQTKTDSFNGRQTLVFEHVQPFDREEKRPLFPVLDDLDVIAVRSEAHVDAIGGGVIQNLSYAISPDGHETLIESVQILMWRQDA